MIFRALDIAYSIRRTDALPWEYSRFSTRLKRLFQSCYQKHLRRNPKYSIGDGCYIALSAGIYAWSLSLGDDCLIAARAVIKDDAKIGDRSIVGLNTYIAGNVEIGRDTLIAHNVSIMGFNHGTRADSLIADQPISTKGITIGEDCWIGANVTIVDGVSIGSHSVIAAGAVVTKDVPEWSVVGGVPSRVIKSRREADGSLASRAASLAQAEA